jgi:predicted nucleic acid-binding protein
VKPVLLDTGMIVALLDPTDSFYARCSDAMADVGAPLVTCETVIAESCYLLRDVEGAAEAILHSVATREFLIPISLADAAVPVRRIMAKYRDRNIDLADAFLIHLADEFSAGDILTVDRDFRIYRWGRNNHFQILVDLGEKREPRLELDTHDRL